MGSLFYYGVYFLISVSLFYFFYVRGLRRVNQISFRDICFMFIGFLSLGGLPPLRGFVIKIVGVQSMLLERNLFWLGGLILGSLLSLFYYLNFLFILFLASDFQ